MSGVGGLGEGVSAERGSLIGDARQNVSRDFVTLRCGCGRAFKDGKVFNRGHAVTPKTIGATCADCDYQSYLGSPGA